MTKNYKNKLSPEVGTINLKSYALKILSYWKYFLVTIIIGLAYAKYKNMKSVNSYKIQSQITVDDNKNPLISSSTNISFNWGGASNIVETIRSKFKSRTHNEKVVTELEYYISYLKENKIFFETQMRDVYGLTPFNIKNKTNNYQLKGKPIKLSFKSPNIVVLSVDFGKELSPVTLFNYHTFKKLSYTPKTQFFKQEFELNNDNTNISTPFLNIVLSKKQNINNQEFYIRFENYNSVVKKYRNLKINTAVKGTSLLNLSITGENKKRVIDYINKTVAVLEKDEKNARISYAVNTKFFIDSLFNIEAEKLKTIENLLINFKAKNNTNLSLDGQRAYNDIINIETEKKAIKQHNNLLSTIKNNSLTNEVEIKNIPLNDLKDVQLTTMFTELINNLLLKERLIANDIYPEHPEFINLENNIKLNKSNLVGKINAVIDYNNLKLKQLDRDMSLIRSSISNLPSMEHELIQLEKNYTLAETNYNVLKQRSYDAGAAIAANSSTIKTIDAAKDVGQAPLASKSQFNYLAALILAIVLPLILITIIEVLDDTLYTIDQLESLYNIPVLGVVGKNAGDTSLILIDQPNSSTAESYRAIRSNLSYLFVGQPEERHRTILCTSSIGGEGKTLTSINIATSYALSDKKTVLLGFDLRKPKIYPDFKVKNNIGIVNYLIGQANLEEITINTEITNLDIVLSGPTPPNPSELILGKNTDAFFKELQDKYDYIIIDTPPAGLVPDALDLMKYSDVNLYITRQGYTKKPMMKMVDQKYNNDEIKNISFILNDYARSNKYSMRYGNGYGYGYSYGGYNSYGYHSDDSEPNLFERLKNIFIKKNVD